MNEWPVDLPTLAQEWQDFEMHNYRHAAQQAGAQEQLMEYRAAFYSGFFACLGCLRKVADRNDDDSAARLIEGYTEEFKRFAIDYIAHRQREAQ
jgi:hypothetical protein